MLNLFKKQWLPDHIRAYIKTKFPEKYFRVNFRIAGKNVEMSKVVGNERRIEFGLVTYIDSEGNMTSETIDLYKGEITYNQVNYAEAQFSLKGIEPSIRKAPSIGKSEKYVNQLRDVLKKKLSAAIDYCPGSLLDRTHEYPITDMPRWRRKRLLSLLANMGENGITAFVSFDLDHAAQSQLEQFNEELELAMMVDNTYEPELEEEESNV